MIMLKKATPLVGAMFLIVWSAALVFSIGSDVDLSSSGTRINNIRTSETSLAENWVQVAKFSAINGQENDFFGTSTSFNGKTLAVGATNAFNYQGGVFIFEEDDGGAINWGQMVTLTNGLTGSAYGVAVGLAGDTLAVGAHSLLNRGAVYIYERNQGGANNWGYITRINSPTPQPEGYFGISLSLEGDRLLVGADEASVNSAYQGAAYIFERNQGGLNNWGLVKELLADDGETNDAFGGSVSLSGDTAAIYAGGVDIGGNNSQGAFYIFEKDNGGVDNWGQVISVTHSSGVDSDFNDNNYLSGDTLAVSTNADEIIFFERNRGGANNWGLAPIKIDPGTGFAGFDLTEDRLAVAVPAAGGKAGVNVYSRNEGGQMLGD